jgi:hypothetical protein
MDEPCTSAPPPGLVAGIDEFNRGEYFEQHETLEVLWRAETRPVRRFYQGILQVGVAFHHVRRGNHHGVMAMLDRGLANLAPFRPSCHGVDVDRLLRDTEAARRAVAALGPSRLAEFDWALAPHIHWLKGDV